VTLVNKVLPDHKVKKVTKVIPVKMLTSNHSKRSGNLLNKKYKLICKNISRTLINQFLKVTMVGAVKAVAVK
jgi:hypothetical protein